MSNNAILAALRHMGIGKEEMTVHGFRAMARTLLDEVLGFRPDFIEHQLAHAVRDPNGRAYNRMSYLPERRKMMQDWADYLDQLKASVEAVEEAADRPQSKVRPPLSRTTESTPHLPGNSQIPPEAPNHRPPPS